MKKERIKQVYEDLEAFIEKGTPIKGGLKFINDNECSCSFHKLLNEDRKTYIQMIAEESAALLLMIESKKISQADAWQVINRLCTHDGELDQNEYTIFIHYFGEASTIFEFNRMGILESLKEEEDIIENINSLQKSFFNTSVAQA